MEQKSFRAQKELLERIEEREGSDSEVIRNALRESMDSGNFGLEDDQYGEIILQAAKFNEGIATGDIETVYEAGNRIREIDAQIGDLFAKGFVSYLELMEEKQNEMIQLTGEYVNAKITGNHKTQNQAMDRLYSLDSAYAKALETFY